MPIPAFLVVSRFKENIDWVDEYTDKYLIYNKGEFIREDPRIISVENTGGNQKDIFRFVVDYYDNLPELMAFVQAYPFDHCKEEVFARIICNDFYTPLEYYGMTPANSFEERSHTGGFMEVNNNWYIHAHSQSNNQTCRYSSLDEFMNKYFENYQHTDYIRFTPGSQFIIEKHQILYYPKRFWQSLFDELPRNNMTEAHIIERSMNMILTNWLILREEWR